MYANEFITFLTYDDEHHRVAIANMPGLLPKPKFLSGVDHAAFTYADLGDLLLTYRRLERSGIKPHWCINHGGTTSMYYHDPDHNQVELQIDNFHSHDEMNAFLDAPRSLKMRLAWTSTPTKCWLASKRASRRRNWCAGRKFDRADPRRFRSPTLGGYTERC